jgi:hypothetical protein
MNKHDKFRMKHDSGVQSDYALGEFAKITGLVDTNLHVGYQLFTEACEMRYIEKIEVLPLLPRTLQSYLLECLQAHGLITVSKGCPLSKYPIDELDSNVIERLAHTVPKDANWVEIRPTQKAMDIYTHGVLQDEIDSIDSILRTLDEWEKEGSSGSS